jgi:hypothetical protein
MFLSPGDYVLEPLHIQDIMEHLRKPVRHLIDPKLVVRASVRNARGTD